MDQDNTPSSRRSVAQLVRELIAGKEQLHSVIYFAASVFSAFLGFITLPLFTALMNKSEIGVYGYALAVNTFVVPLLTLSLESYYLKTVFHVKNHDSEKRLLSSLVYFIALWSLVFTCFLLISGPLIFNLAGIRIAFYPTVAIMLCSNLFYGFTIFALLRYRLKAKVWNYFFLTIVQNLLTTGFSLMAVVMVSHSAASRISGYTTATILTGIVSFLVLVRHLKPVIDKDTIRQALRFAFPLIPYVFSSLLIDLIDRFFLEKYAHGDLSELANYNIAFQYANIALMVSVALFRSYEPEFFRLAVHNDHAALVRKINRFNLVNFLCSALLILTANFLLNLLTHGKFNESVALAQWLIVVLFLKSAFLNLNTVLTALGKNTVLMYVSLAALTGAVIASPFIIPDFQASGTVFLKGSLYLVVFLCTWIWFVRHKVYLVYLLLTLTLVALLSGLTVLCTLFF